MFPTGNPMMPPQAGQGAFPGWGAPPPPAMSPYPAPPAAPSYPAPPAAAPGGFPGAPGADSFGTPPQAPTGPAGPMGGAPAGGPGADPMGGMDLNALMSMLGGDPTAAGGGPGAAMPGMAPNAAMPDQAPGAGAAPTAPGGGYTWGPNGSVIAQNAGGGGLSGSLPGGKALLLGALAAAGVVGFKLFQNRDKNDGEITTTGTAQEQFAQTLQQADEVKAALGNAELDAEAKNSKVNEFRVDLQNQLGTLKDENAALIEQPQREELKAAFEAIEATLAELKGNSNVDKLDQATTHLNEQFDTLKAELEKTDETADTPQAEASSGVSSDAKSAEADSGDPA